MSVKTIAGGFNGAFWWYGPLSEDPEFFKANLPKLSCGEFNNFFLNLKKKQEIIRKRHQTFLQMFWMTYRNVIIVRYHYVHV